MFDIGLSELIVICIVSFVFLDFKDIPKIFRFIKNIIKEINSYFEELKKALEEIDSETKTILDDDGNEHISYNLDDIMPKIRDSNDRGKK